jgi:hypothetical protein
MLALKILEQLNYNMAQAFEPAGSGDFPVASFRPNKHETGMSRQPADKNVCATDGNALAVVFRVPPRQKFSADGTVGCAKSFQPRTEAQTARAKNH